MNQAALGFGVAAFGCAYLGLVDRGWERSARVGFVVLALTFAAVATLEVFV